MTMRFREGDEFMMPGYLHLDIRRGLKADLLNAAVAGLVTDHAAVRNIIDRLDIDGLSYVVNEYTHCSIKGYDLRFFVHDTIVNADGAVSCAGDIFSRPSVSLREIRSWLLNKDLPPRIGALTEKILEQLDSDIFTEQNLTGGDALWLVCHSVLWSALIDTLDPKFITATKICVSEHVNAKDLTTTLSLTNSLWLHQLLIGMPVVEVAEQVPVDVVAVAFIKALAGHVGARGESRIMKVSIGLLSGPSLLTPIVAEALFCEPSLPESITEQGLSNDARLHSLHEITGSVAATTDMISLAQSLSLHGAMSMTWHLAYRDKGLSCYIVRFLIHDEDKRDAIEAFLIKGSAFDVAVSVVERHELNRRLVSVPIGTGNKATTARFYEFVYFDKTVRVEPLHDDLEAYVKKTDYSVDVARSDLLLAWKKWRGRVVPEDT